jgi:hypothetical protein
LTKILLPVGGEESTIEFMESQSLMDSSSPLLEEAYSYGVVEHPFPLNCILRDWHLGPDFYNAVKIGIVQYVCAYFLIEDYCIVLFILHFAAYVWCLPKHYFQMILKMICALLAMILETFGVYGEGKFEWRYG